MNIFERWAIDAMKSDHRRQMEARDRAHKRVGDAFVLAACVLAVIILWRI